MSLLGVSRREISWRVDRARLLPGISALPAWADALILVSLASYLMLGLAAAAPSRSEAVQIALTRDAHVLVTHPGSLLPGGASSATEEAARLGYGSFARYAAAPGWYLSGRGQARPIDLSGLRPGTGEVPLKPVSERSLLATRAGPAVLAALSVFVLFFLVRRLLGRPAATVAVLIFALQPVALSTGRQVSDSGVTVLFGLAAIFVATGIGARLAGGREPSLSAWTGLGLWSGLCLAAGLSAAPFVAGAASFCLAGVASGYVRRQRRLLAGEAVEGPGPGRIGAWLLVSAFGTVIAWVLVSPSLWGWLPQRLGARHDDRSWLIAQGLVPDPGERGWAGRAAALPRLLDGPGASLLLYAGALVGVVVLLWAARSVRLTNLSRRGAVALLGWAGLTVLWFVFWPSTQPEHEVPLLVVASVMAASLVAWAQNAGLGWWPGPGSAEGLVTSDMDDSGLPDQLGHDRG